MSSNLPHLPLPRRRAAPAAPRQPLVDRGQRDAHRSAHRRRRQRLPRQNAQDRRLRLGHRPRARRAHHRARGPPRLLARARAPRRLRSPPLPRKQRLARNRPPPRNPRPPGEASSATPSDSSSGTPARRPHPRNPHPRQESSPSQRRPPPEPTPTQESASACQESSPGAGRHRSLRRARGGRHRCGATSPRAPAAPRPATARWEALGTSVVLRVTDPSGCPARARLLARELDAIDRACSRFRADSDLTRVNAHAGGRPVRGRAAADRGAAGCAARRRADRRRRRPDCRRRARPRGLRPRLAAAGAGGASTAAVVASTAAVDPAARAPRWRCRGAPSPGSHRRATFDRPPHARRPPTQRLPHRRARPRASAPCASPAGWCSTSAPPPKRGPPTAPPARWRRRRAAGCWSSLGGDIATAGSAPAGRLADPRHRRPPLRPRRARGRRSRSPTAALPPPASPCAAGAATVRRCTTSSTPPPAPPRAGPGAPSASPPPTAPTPTSPPPRRSCAAGARRRGWTRLGLPARLVAHDGAVLPAGRRDWCARCPSGHAPVFSPASLPERRPGHRNAGAPARGAPRSPAGERLVALGRPHERRRGARRPTRTRSLGHPRVDDPL